MAVYARNIKRVSLPDDPTEPDRKATEKEVTLFRSLAGELVWIGCGVLPQAAAVGSLLQQQVSHLRVSHIRRANNILGEIQRLRSVILYPPPPAPVVEAKVTTFSDAAFNISPQRSYGQSGLVFRLQCKTRDGDGSLFYLLD